MSERHLNSGENYRFGFNGQEKVDEISGVGNHTTATFWEYDTRLGRRWNIDPIDQVSISNYAAFKNNPIIWIDPNGDSPREKRLGPNQSASGAESTGNHTSNTVNATTTVRSNSDISVTKTESQRYGGVVSTTSTLSGSTQNINNVSNKSAEVIAESMRSSGVSGVEITSTQRTPEQQASAMYNNSLNNGANSQYELYGPSGDKVIETYEQYSPEWCCTKSEAVDAMSAKIRLVGAENVSKHAADPSKLNVIDLSNNAIPSNKRQELHNALQRNSGVSRLFTPFNSNDPAFHVEIPQR